MYFWHSPKVPKGLVAANASTRIANAWLAGATTLPTFNRRFDKHISYSEILIGSAHRRLITDPDYCYLPTAH